MINEESFSNSSSKQKIKTAINIDRKQIELLTNRRGKEFLTHCQTQILKGKEFLNLTSKGVDFFTKSKLRIYDQNLLQANNEIQNMLNTSISHLTGKKKEDDSESQNSIESIPEIDLFTHKTVLRKKKTSHNDNTNNAQHSNFMDNNNNDSIEEIKNASSRSNKKSIDDIASVASEKTVSVKSEKKEEKISKKVSLTTIRKMMSKRRAMMSLPNVYDSFCDEEIDIDDIDAKDSFHISPDHPLLIYWELLITILILYSITISPYLLAFSIDNLPYKVIDIISDFVFLCDLVLNFFIGYFDSDNDTLVSSKAKIAVHYLKSFFIVDLISSIPFSLISTVFINNDDNIKNLSQFQKIDGIRKIFRLLKWMKLFKIFKYSNQSISSSDKKENINLISSFTKTKIGIFLKFLIFITLLIHCCSCMWIFIGQLYKNNTTTDSWLNLPQMRNKPQSYIYVSSLYFLMNSMLSDGYGDITATSLIERLFMICFMMVGCAVYSLMLTTLSSIFSRIDPKTYEFAHKECVLEQLRCEYPISDSLYDNIKKALKHDYYKWKEDQLKLLDSLPGSLRNDLYLKMNENQIKHLHFFKNQSYDFILFTVPLLKSVQYSKDDMIISVGNLVEEMFMIIRGTVSLRIGYKYNNYEIGVLRYGEHFGDIIMYLNDQSNYDIKIKSKTAELFCLSKTNFANIKLNFREAVDQILKYSYRVFSQIEQKRKSAIEYYAKKGKFEGFKMNYLIQNEHTIKDNDNIFEDNSWMKGTETFHPQQSINSNINPYENNNTISNRSFTSNHFAPLSPRKSLRRPSVAFLQKFQNFQQRDNMIYINNLNINYNNNSFNRAPSLDLLDIKKRRVNADIGLDTSQQLMESKIYNKEAFLQSLNQKIENNAMMNQNKNLLQNYIINFIEEKEEQTKLSKMIRKLNQIEKELKCKKKQI